MRKSLIIVFLLSLSLSIQSQNDLGKSDDEARIVLNTFVPDDILENAPSQGIIDLLFLEILIF